MKKTVIRLVGTLALASFLVSGCSNLDDQNSISYKESLTEIVDSSQPSNTDNEPTLTNNSKEIASVLNREIFIFKESSPELYTVTINDMDQAVAYTDNWTFSKILNESNYKDIKWEVSSEDNNITIVAFSGTARINNAVCYVQFCIFNDARPLAISLYLYSEKTDTAEELSAKRFLEENKHLDSDLATIYADAAISSMLIIMAEDAFAPTSSNANKNTTNTTPSSGNTDMPTATPPIAETKPNVPETTPAKTQKDYYDEAIKYMGSKDYLSAAKIFKQITDYSDASDKYKEANYLHGEKLLEQGDVESAKAYFCSASGYSDADTRVQRYYYEVGETSLKSGDFLTAIDAYALADNYSDARKKILEGYYQYGKEQLSLNYITEATTYLSKCRGYKDTDEILLSFYYGEASKAVKVLMDAFPAHTFTTTVEKAYKDAKNKLVMCEGYKDSESLLAIVEKLYYVWTEMPFESSFKASLNEMKASYSEDTITITKLNFMTYQSCVLQMTHNTKNNTLVADITDIFAISARGYDFRKVFSAMLILFTDINDTTDLDAKFSDVSNWTISENSETFTMSYGGYNIVVQIAKEDANNYDCSISATK